MASFDDPEKVLILVESEEADIVLWEQWGTIKEDIQRLWGIMRGSVNPLLLCFCSWRDPVPDGLPPFVRHSFRHPPDPEELTHLLGLFVVDRPSRRDRRFRKRIMFRLHPFPSVGEERGILCSSVDVSASGLLIESNQPLQVGRLYDAELIGVSAGRIRSVRILVLRENPRHGYSILSQYACRFEGVTPDEQARLRATLGLKG